MFPHYVHCAVELAPGIAGLYGLEGAVNVQGEDVSKLDIVSNNNFINAIQASRASCIMVSEENENCIMVEDRLAGTCCPYVFLLLTAISSKLLLLLDTPLT